jgi:hypothetical protein
MLTTCCWTFLVVRVRRSAPVSQKRCGPNPPCAAAYTTVRTVNLQRVYQFDMHIARLGAACVELRLPLPLTSPRGAVTTVESLLESAPPAKQKDMGALANADAMKARGACLTLSSALLSALLIRSAGPQLSPRWRRARARSRACTMSSAASSGSPSWSAGGEASAPFPAAVVHGVHNTSGQ